MELTPRYQSAAWSVPVPVRPSHMFALSPEHQVFNIQVDLGQLTPFGYATESSDDEEFLYADLQSSPTDPVGLRLGSGRSGFYRGKYLKGVGRTQLAGNWRSRNDVYHGTGHLQASAAVREYIVSCYLRAQGAVHTIVPCEGILLGPLHNDLCGYERALSRYGKMIPIDLKFQAISIKDSHFARHSNFVWALNNPMFNGHYAWLFKSLYYYATMASPQRLATGIGPTEIASALSKSMKQGFSYYETYLRTGVFWGSFKNNFTLDGRFLDLEVPQIFGRPFFGLLTKETECPRGTSGAFIGCEAISYVVQVRHFIEYLMQRLRFLLGTKAFAHPLDQEFVGAFLVAIESVFNADHVIMNQEAIIDTIFKWLLTHLEVPPLHRSTLRDVVHSEYVETASRKGPDRLSIGYQKLPLQLASTEFYYPRYTFYPDFLDLDAGREEAVHINHALDAIDHSTSLDQLMRGIEQLANDINGMSSA